MVLALMPERRATCPMVRRSLSRCVFPLWSTRSITMLCCPPSQEKVYTFPSLEGQGFCRVSRNFHFWEFCVPRPRKKGRVLSAGGSRPGAQHSPNNRVGSEHQGRSENQKA